LATTTGVVATGTDVAVASAPADDVADDAAWTTEQVPGLDVVVRYPEGWVHAPVSELQQQVGTQAKVLLAAGDPDPNGTGDNVLVNRFTGRNAAWYGELADYRAEVEGAAAQHGGKVLSIGARKVAGRPAYWSVEQEIDGRLGRPVLYGDVQIRTAKHAVVTVFVTMAATGASARATVDGIVRGVRRATN
jgi:hypothetical protein